MRWLQLLMLLGAASVVQAQDINVRLAEDTPNPVYSIDKGAASQVIEYDPSAAASSVIAAVEAGDLPQSSKKLKKLKRSDGDCSPKPTGYGPVPTPDTQYEFLNSPEISSLAKEAPTPSGYSLSFQDLHASSSAYGYLGFISLESYDTNGCASKCNEKEGCQAVNIFVERSPTLNVGPECPNPSSTSVIKCVFWGGPVNKDNTNNAGYTDNSFVVAIAGSNGYNKGQAGEQVTGYDGPTQLDAAINAPLDCNDSFDTYMGVKIFTEGPFDPKLCAAACTATSDYNREHPPEIGPVKTCQFFNTYILLKNGQFEGQYCAMYTRAWDSSYATNPGQWRGDDYYSVQNSLTYKNTTESGQYCPPLPPSSTTSSSIPASSSPVSSPSTTPAPDTSATPSPTTTLATKTTTAKPSNTACTCAASAKPQAKPSKSSICNKKGYNYLQAPFSKFSGPKSVPSQDICAWKCLQDSKCKSFAYNPSLQVCIEYEQDVKGLGVWWQTWPFGGWASYDKGCYEYDCSKGSCDTYQPDKGLLPFLAKCQRDSQCACGRCLTFGNSGVCL